MAERQEIHIEGENAKTFVINGNAYGANIAMSDEEILTAFYQAGSLIRDYRSVVADNFHIDRPVTTEIYQWLVRENKDQKERVCALLGNAGQGKTVVMRDLLLKLEAERIPVLGIKADAFVVENVSVLKAELGLRIEVIDAIRQLAKVNKLVVLIIDQIDALSLSLSSDRSPLNTFNRLIQMVARIGNVKIALSCRSFDWDYDSILSDYRRYSSTFHISDLPLDSVEETLKRVGDDIHTKTPTLQTFLRTPLHLYLYCQLHEYVKDNEDITLTDLYNTLWDKVVVSPLAKGCNVECLRYVSKEMYDKQILHLASRIVDAKYRKEKVFLASHNFLCEQKGLQPTIQFIHQSLFDYVYARLFVESGRLLIEDILAEHQGLFVRARIKQYFQYLREVDETRYIKELQGVLEHQDIRFHIKHLLITWLGCLVNPQPGEMQLVNSYVLPIAQRHTAFVGSVRTTAWFEFIVEKDKLVDGVVGNDSNAIAEASVFFHRLGYDRDHSLCLVNFLHKLLRANNDSARKFISDNFERIRNWDMPEMTNLFRSIIANKLYILPNDYLEHIVEQEPELVGEILEKNLIEQLNEKGEYHHSFRWDYQTEQVYENLCKVDWKVALTTTLHCIEILSSMTAYTPRIDGLKLYQSSEYYFYNRGNIYLNTSDEWVNYARKKVKEVDTDDIQQFIDFLNKSEQCICKLILVDLYIARLEEFYPAAFDLVNNLDILNSIDSNTKYFMFQLVKAVFGKASDSERVQIINTIKQIAPPGEDIYHKPFAPGCPHNYKGYTRCEFYFALGEDYLRQYDHNALKEYLELKRKYKVNNDPPGKMTTHVGWTGINQKALDRMSNKDLLEKMHNVKDSITADFEKPTPQGLAMQLNKMAVKDYDRFKVLLEKAFEQNVDFIYKHEILMGLMESKQIQLSDISILYQRLIDEEMDKEPSKACLISLIRCLKYYIDSTWQIPDGILDFVCGIASEYDDTTEHPWNDEEEHLFNTGINQVRGCAANYLTHYTYRDDGLSKVIAALKCVAETGTPPTRSAMLLELGFLSNKDIESMAEIYIKAVTRDYHHSLLHIPLYRVNPLVVLLGHRFDLIESFLWDVVNGDYANDDFASVCWIGWLWGNSSCKDMLLTLLLKNHKARLNWLHYVASDSPVKFKDEYITVLKQILPFVDKDFAKTFDGHFDDINKVIVDWSELEPIIDQFVANPASSFSNHSFFKFIERNTPYHAEKCLEWTMKLIGHVNVEDQNRILSRLIEVMLNAYNTIRAYKKGNEIEELAMTTFDKVLSDTDECKTLIPFLYKLDE